MKRKFQRIKIGDRFDVKGYIPPGQLVGIAEDRTAGMVAAFVHMGGRADMLQRLATSCYMQGVNDTTDALIMQKMLKEPQ